MSILWSGLTEEGAIVPVQVDNTGRVIAIAKDEGLDYWEKNDNTLRPSDGENVLVDGTISSSVSFTGPTASFSEDIDINGLTVGTGGSDIETNTAVGLSALPVNTTGSSNTAVGFSALFSNTEGVQNTAVGQNALNNNITGDNNTAVGLSALSKNSEGSSNAAFGNTALNKNSTGTSNTAVGSSALFSNTEGVQNTAVGRSALYNSTTSDNNTAVGQRALNTNTEGSSNTAIGHTANYKNTTGDNNTAVGQRALYRNSTGKNNTVIGQSANYNNSTGSNNTFIGQNPGIEGLSDTVCISAGSQERLWINSEGQTGIGTNNPQATLDVAGPVLFANGLCGFLSTGEIFFQSRNTSYKLVVDTNGLVSAETIPTALLELDDRKQLVIPPAPETKADELLPEMDMDNDNA